MARLRERMEITRSRREFYGLRERWYQQAATWLLQHVAEVTTVLLAFLGWLLITWAVAKVAGRWGFGAEAWAVSAGLLCLGLVGFQFIGHIIFKGLYALSTEEPAPPRPPLPED